MPFNLVTLDPFMHVRSHVTAYIYNLPYDMINLALKIFLQIHMTTKSTNAILELNNSKVSEASINQRNLSN
jgi:hypothetical protein